MTPPFLINPYRYSVVPPVAGCFYNHYAMNFIRTTTSADIEYLHIDNKSNAVDTAIRDTTPQFTISGWLQLDSSVTGVNRTIFSKYNAGTGGNDSALIIVLNSSNQLQIYGTTSSGSVNVNLKTSTTYSSADGWFHFCFAYDSSKTTASEIVRVYINGVEITTWDTFTVNTTTKSFNDAALADRAPIRLGAAKVSGNIADGFAGELDEFTFWDKPLTASEVTELYNSKEAKEVSDMSAYSNNLAWWRMGDYASDNWDGTKWNIVNVKGTADTDLISVNLVEADKITDTGVIGYPASIENLRAYYKLDGDVIDSSGNGFNASSTTDITYAAGKYSDAGDFNGSSSVALFGDRWIDSLDDLTISAWVKPGAGAYGGFSNFIGQYEAGGAGKWFSLNTTTTSGAMQFAVDAGGAGGAARQFVQLGGFSTGAWHHIVGVRDTSTGTLKIYRDYNAATGSTSAYAGTLTLGGEASLGNIYTLATYFDGELDDISVWNRVLTEAEISDLYNSTCPLTTLTPFNGSISGGTITTDGIYTYHTFNSSDTLEVDGSGEIDYLIVAGGAGGGGGDWSSGTGTGGGGGGAGGYRAFSSQPISTGSFTVTVGAGGAGATQGTNKEGANGSDSSFNSTTNTGGGGGANPGSGGVANSGLAGGSGGGSAGSAGGSTTGGAGTAGQGNDGGASSTGRRGVGGGGGKAAAGQDGTFDTASGGSGSGGAGLDWLDGTYYAGGGGGGRSDLAAEDVGGIGGGGDGGGTGAGQAGTANTGGGGGGGGGSASTGGTGGAGGSGVVIIRYVTP